MNETYLLLIGGLVAGILSAVIGGLIFYGNLLKTRAMLHNRVEREKIALYNDISEFDENEFSGTEAGKDLVTMLLHPEKDIKDPLENFGTGLRRHNRDLVKQLEETRKKLAQSEQTKQALGVAQSRITDLEKSNKDLLNQTGAAKPVISTAPLKLEELAEKDLYDIIKKAGMDTLSEAKAKRISRGAVELPPEFATNEVSIYADRDALKQILIHLDKNAIAASPVNGTVKLRMQIEADKTGKEYLVFQASEAGGSIFSAEFPIAKNVNPVTSTAPLTLKKDWKKVIDDAMFDTHSQALAKHISVSAVLSIEVATNEVSIHADRKDLKQILIHLFKNAIAASPVRGSVKLLVRKTPGKEELVFQVSDTGEGISAGVFTGGSGSIKGVGDTGALSSAKSLTEAQKGGFWPASNPSGAIFSVALPIAKNVKGVPSPKVEDELDLTLEELTPGDLQNIVDNALTYTASSMASLLKVKGILMPKPSGVVPQNLAPIYADFEALKQILIHLFKNAIDACPVKGSVKLQIQTKVTGREYVLIQVSDTGRGIATDKLPVLFTYGYHGDTDINGVGDAGRLSIAKTLIEAQKGIISVESKQGVGSTFSVLLPIAKNVNRVMSKAPTVKDALQLPLEEIAEKDLNSILDNARFYTDGEKEAKAVTTKFPSAMPVPSILANREALQQVLILLYHNAIAASPEKAVVEYQFKTTAVPGYLSIHFSDKGGGISKADADRVFTHGFRADHPIKGVGDTGALSMAKTLTDAQKGNIWFTPNPGGSTFSVAFPAK